MFLIILIVSPYKYLIKYFAIEHSQVSQICGSQHQMIAGYRLSNGDYNKDHCWMLTQFLIEDVGNRDEQGEANGNNCCDEEEK